MPLEKHAMQTPCLFVCHAAAVFWPLMLARFGPVSMEPREADKHGSQPRYGEFKATIRNAELRESKFLRRCSRSTSCHGGQWLAVLIGLLLLVLGPCGAFVYSPRLTPGGAIAGRSSLESLPTKSCVRSKACGSFLLAAPRGDSWYTTARQTVQSRLLLTCFSCVVAFLQKFMCRTDSLMSCHELHIIAMHFRVAM